MEGHEVLDVILCSFCVYRAPLATFRYPMTWVGNATPDTRLVRGSFAWHTGFSCNWLFHPSCWGNVLFCYCWSSWQSWCPYTPLSVKLGLAKEGSRLSPNYLMPPRWHRLLRWWHLLLRNSSLRITQIVPIFTQMNKDSKLKGKHEK